MLSLDALEIFLAVIESGSFSEAGRRLHISQSAVSQAVRNLEKQLDMDLFIRKGRTASLTEAGQVLFPMAQELISSSQRIEQTLLSLQTEVGGELSIGCSTASGKYLLPGMIARFRKQYPQVRSNVIVTSRESVFNKLLSGSIALGITSKQVENHNLEYQDFFKDDVILIVPAGHRWAQYPQIYPDDLLDEPIILREEAAGTREVLMENLIQRDITFNMLNVAMVLGNAEAICIAVEEGLGVAFISRLVAARSISLGKVVEVKVTGMELTRDIFIARNHYLPLTLAQARFWEFTREIWHGARDIKTETISDEILQVE